MGWGSCSAISTIISKLNIKKKYIEGFRILYHCIIINLILSISIIVIIFYFGSYITIFNQPRKIILLTIPFLKILIFSLIPYLLFETLKKFCEGLLIIQPGIYIIWIGVITNFIFNYIFIYNKFNINRFNYLGSAYSSLISRIIMVIILFLFILNNNKTSLYFNDMNFYLEYKYIKEILKIGIPISCQLFFEVGAFIIISFIIGSISTEELIAHQITLNIISTTYIISLGLSIAATLRISKEKALKNFNKLKNISISILIISITIMLIIGIILILFNNKLSNLYIKDISIIKITKKLIILSSIFQFLDGLQTVFVGILRGIQDTKRAMWISLITYCCICLPSAYIFAVKFNMKALGVWVSLIISLLISCTLLIIRYYKKIFFIKKK